MKNKIFRAVILILISVLPVYNLINMNTKDIETVLQVSVDEKLFPEFDGLNVSSVEKRINKLVKEKEAAEEALRLEEERRLNYEKLVSQLENGEITFRKLFSDTLIVGDSLMQGLNTYRILDSANMISMVSASLYHLEGNMRKIISNNPETLILHYGINMLGNTEEQLSWFIEMYEEIITELRKELPDTNIFVSGIFNVSPEVEDSYPYVNKYNEALSKMCERTDVFYLDNSECLPGDGSFYGSDGIHVAKSFYNDIWLPYVFNVMYFI